MEWQKTCLRHLMLKNVCLRKQTYVTLLWLYEIQTCCVSPQLMFVAACDLRITHPLRNHLSVRNDNNRRAVQMLPYYTKHENMKWVMINCCVYLQVDPRPDASRKCLDTFATISRFLQLLVKAKRLSKLCCLRRYAWLTMHGAVAAANTLFGTIACKVELKAFSGQVIFLTICDSYFVNKADVRRISWIVLNLHVMSAALLLHFSSSSSRRLFEIISVDVAVTLVGENLGSCKLPMSM